MKTILDWKVEKALELELMRKNTRRWQRSGLLKRPMEVQIREAENTRVMTVRPRKTVAGA